MTGDDPRLAKPWPALWSLVFGFFMILVDSTIVTIALPAIMSGLHTDLTGAMWVTSAYLLAYVVPLLVTGRLGDTFGPKTLYLIGLSTFTVASVLCGLAGTIEALIAARVLQGLGAACISPQTMTAITHMFPGRSRGSAMAVWGATAGVAMLVGPILGGVLTDALGWEWIFFINLPVGIIGVIVAVRNVPRFVLTPHRMDWLGAVLSTLGLGGLVFGIQEGERFGWGTITDNLTLGGWRTGLTINVWGLIGGAVVLIAAFVIWEVRNRNEPLIPMALFRDRNFTLANITVAAQGFAVTGAMLPVIIYFQAARGLSPTQAGMMLAPMAIMSVLLAQPVGRLVQRVDPKWVAALGFGLCIGANVWFFLTLHSDTPIWELLLPATVQGAGSSMVWSPLSVVATYRLSHGRAGAGSGVYNMMRQVGSVLGSAAITAAMEARIAAQLGAGTHDSTDVHGHLPAPMQEPFSRAMAEAILAPGAAMLLGLLLVFCFQRLPRSEQPGVVQEGAGTAEGVVDHAIGDVPGDPTEHPAR